MKRLDYRGLKPELLGIASLNFAAAEDSAARQEMLGSHVAQCLVIKRASIRRCLTGMERVFGTATFNIKMPHNGEIRAIVEKYPRAEGPDAIRMNPHTTIIFENIEKGQLDVLEMPYHHCKHNHYGFRYKLTPKGEALTTRVSLPKGTVLADSPNVDEHGNYKLGVELNAVFASIPGTIEDGVIISHSTIDKLTAMGFEKRAGSFGRKRYPLNLYPGANGEYQPFPNIGERIREDGLLFAFREYNELLAGVEMAEDSLRQVDHVFDRRVYGIPSAKVVDVVSRRGTSNQKPRTPAGMEKQAQKYHEAHARYYDELQRITSNLEHAGRSKITSRLHRLLVEGLVFKNDSIKNRPKQMYNLQELDEWRVDVTFEYMVRPNVGSKITNLHGGKGVICQVLPDEDMPVDIFGTRAEVIMDGNSIIKRMNPGVLFEQWFNAYGDQVKRDLIKMREANPATFYTEGWDFLMRFYGMVSPKMVEVLNSKSYKQRGGSPKRHIDEILKDCVHLWFPLDSPVTLQNAAKALKANYPLIKGPITYRGRSGKVVTTRRNIEIGSVYYVLLEKIGDDWSGVSSTKLQHFGIPAKINKHDKHATPARPMPVRILGESEVRLMVAACGGQPVARLIEMSNSPQLHKHVVMNILKASKPSDIESIVTDPNLIDRGGRNLAFVHHSLEISGVRFVRQDKVSDLPRIYEASAEEPSL